jgi:hypothetical protein
MTKAELVKEFVEHPKFVDGTAKVKVTIKGKR